METNFTQIQRKVYIFELKHITHFKRLRTVLVINAILISLNLNNMENSLEHSQIKQKRSGDRLTLFGV